jgi:protein-disulfide isomerase
MTTEWMRRRTPKSIIGLAAVAVAAAAGALWVSSLAAQENAKKPAVPEVMARVGDQTIDRDAVIEEASKSLQDVEAERLQCQQAADRNEHEALQSAVQRVVHRRIFALEAERRGMTEDALREQLKAQTGEVTDADVDAFYEANRAQIQQPKEQITDQIRAYLKQQRLQKADADFFAEMEKNFKVDYLLEPLRVEVAATGSARGPATAPVTIVEFSDFQCPYCSKAEATVKDLLELEKYKGKLRLVYRDYPLPSHNLAPKAAEAAHCAGDQGKYWEFHDRLFAATPKLEVTDLKSYARDLKLDEGRFSKCLDSGEKGKVVADHFKAGNDAGVRGTPAFFINGRLISGAQKLEAFTALIDAELIARK